MRTDAELAVAACRGDRSAFPVLVDRHLPGLFGFFRYLGAGPSQVDDLVQEVFLRAFKSLGTYDPARSAFGTWVFSIGRHLFYEKYQSRGRETPMESLPETTDSGIEDRIVDRHLVEEALVRLPEGARFIIELRVFRDLPFAEIEKLTGETQGALRVRFHRAMKLLRRLLEGG